MTTGIDPVSLDDLSRQIAIYCAPRERSVWDVLSEYEEAAGFAAEALALAFTRRKLVRRLTDSGWIYRSAFLGVDIDRAHLVQEAA